MCLFVASAAIIWVLVKYIRQLKQENLVLIQRLSEQESTTIIAEDTYEGTDQDPEIREEIPFSPISFLEQQVEAEGRLGKPKVWNSVQVKPLGAEPNGAIPALYLNPDDRPSKESHQKRFSDDSGAKYALRQVSHQLSTNVTDDQFFYDLAQDVDLN